MVPLSLLPLCPLDCCNYSCANTSIRRGRCLLSGRERPPFSRLFARQNALRRYGVAPGDDGEIVGVLFRDPSSPSSKCNSDDLDAALTCDSPPRACRERKTRRGEAEAQAAFYACTAGESKKRLRPELTLDPARKLFLPGAGYFSILEQIR